MTTTKTVPEHGESLADLYLRLAAQGANPDHLRAVTDHMDRRHNAERARLGRLYFGNSEGKEIGASDFCRRLEDLALRAFGVEAAVTSLAEDSPGKISSGVVLLVAELATDLERLSEAFAAETKEERQRAGRDALRVEMEAGQ